MNHNITEMGNNFGVTYQRQSSIKLLSETLNFIESELKKDILAVYLCIFDSPHCSARNVSDARNLLGVLNRYSEDETIKSNVSGLLNFSSVDRFSDGLADTTEFIQALIQGDRYDRKGYSI